MRARRAVREVMVPATSILTAAPTVQVVAVMAAMQEAHTERENTRLRGTPVAERENTRLGGPSAAEAPRPAHYGGVGVATSVTRAGEGGEVQGARDCAGPVLLYDVRREPARTESKSGESQGGKQWFSEQKEAAFTAHLLEKGMTLGTVERYKAGPQVWHQYLDSLEEQYRPDPLLTEVLLLKDKGKFLLDFGLDLYNRRGLRGKQITGLFTHLRSYFEAGFEVSGIFDHPIMTKVRKTMRRTSEEERLYQEARVRQGAGKTPYSLDMVDRARSTSWDATSWGTNQGRDAKACYLGMALMGDTGCRNSNLTGPETRKAPIPPPSDLVTDDNGSEGKGGARTVITDHGALAKHFVVLLDLYDAHGTPIKMFGGPGLQQYLASHAELGYPSVLSAALEFVSNKTIFSRAGRLMPVADFGRTDPMEERLLVDMLDWLRHNKGQQEDDYLLTRYNLTNPGLKKLMQRSALASLIKATAVDCGLCPKAFSTSSGRGCFATHANENGMSEHERNLRADWARGSKTPNTHYAARPTTRGAMALGGDAFTLAHVRSMVAQPLQELPDMGNIPVAEHADIPSSDDGNQTGSDSDSDSDSADGDVERADLVADALPSHALVDTIPIEELRADRCTSTRSGGRPVSGRWAASKRA
jgi:hypothetical protein